MPFFSLTVGPSHTKTHIHIQKSEGVEAEFHDGVHKTSQKTLLGGGITACDASVTHDCTLFSSH